MEVSLDEKIAITQIEFEYSPYRENLEYQDTIKVVDFSDILGGH